MKGCDIEKRFSPSPPTQVASGYEKIEKRKTIFIWHLFDSKWKRAEMKQFGEGREKKNFLLWKAAFIATTCHRNAIQNVFSFVREKSNKWLWD